MSAKMRTNLGAIMLTIAALPFLVGQSCVPTGILPAPPDPAQQLTVNPVSGEPTAPAIPPSSRIEGLPPPLPLSDPEVSQIYLLDSTRAEDVSAYIEERRTVNDGSLVVQSDPDSRHTAVIWIRFGLAGLPTNVEKAILNLFCLTDSGDASGQFNIDRLLEPWTETGIQSTPRWGPYARTGLPIIAGRWIRIDITSLYRSWSADGGNFGVQLRLQNSYVVSLNYSFGSSEHPDQNRRPFLDLRSPGAEPLGFRFPLDGRYAPDRVSGYHFGDHWQNQYCQGGDPTSPRLLHTGTDLRANFGDPVAAIARGTVVLRATDDQWGGYVVVQHDSSSGSFTSIYEHLAPAPDIIAGAAVTKGQLLGVITSGTAGYGAHLHLGIRWGTFDPRWSLIGRLPERACGSEVSFPGSFSNPESLLWE